jgi:predicted nucleic acid-binding protein
LLDWYEHEWAPAQPADPLIALESVVRDHEATIRQIATILAFDASCASRYAAIRSDRGIKAPDAIQLACAAAAGVDLFITNDDRLSRKHVPDVKFITSLERAYL